MGEFVSMEHSERQIVTARETSANGRHTSVAGMLQAQLSAAPKTRESTVDGVMEFTTARIAGAQSTTRNVVKSMETDDDCERSQSRLAGVQIVTKVSEVT